MGGGLALECGTAVHGCAAIMTPSLQASYCSLASQFTINTCRLLICPSISIFRKFCIFLAFFAKISALQMQIFIIFVPKTSHFLRKICSVNLTFRNPHSTHTHTHTKKLSASSPRTSPPPLASMRHVHFNLFKAG